MFLLSIFISILSSASMDLQGFDSALENVEERFHVRSEFALAIVSMSLGILLNVFGIHVPKISLAALSTFLLIHLAPGLFDHLKNGTIFGFSITNPLKENISEFFGTVSESETLFYIIILVISFFISWIIVSFVNIITGKVLIAIGYVLYNEGIIFQLFGFLSIENIFLKIAIIVTIFLILMRFFIYIQNIIFVLIFAFFGSMFMTYAFDFFFGCNWKIKELLNGIKDGNAIDLDQHGIYAWVLTFMFGLGAQSVYIFSKK